MIKNGLPIKNANVALFGITFKEDCPDIRNSKVFDLARILNHSRAIVEIYDPLINQSEVDIDHSFSLVEEPKNEYYDVIILAVDHSIFCSMPVSEVKKFGIDEAIVFDVKSIFPIQDTDDRL